MLGQQFFRSQIIGEVPNTPIEAMFELFNPQVYASENQNLAQYLSQYYAPDSHTGVLTNATC